MRVLMALSLLLSGLLFTLTPATPSPANAANCEFVLGFKTLHDMIPNIVGECLENARFDTGIGEALQATTGTRTDGGFGGLLVWRKADNLTWFSDGINTWINGPQGLQRRLSTQRFPWELDTLETAAYNLQGLAFVLNQGKAELSTDQPQVVRLLAQLDENTVAYGDLNGDGVADAAVRVVVNTGGSGSFNYLVAMVSSDGTTKQTASVLLGDRVKVNSITISNGTITVDEIVQGPNDPQCCPTQPKVVQYRLVGDTLQQVVP